MKSELTNENFERFLQQNADGLRMRPSEHVWRGVAQHLNRRRRRLGLAFGAFLLVATSLGYFLIKEVPGPREQLVVTGTGNAATTSQVIPRKTGIPVMPSMNQAGTTQQHQGTTALLYSGNSFPAIPSVESPAGHDADPLLIAGAGILEEFQGTIVDHDPEKSIAGISTANRVFSTYELPYSKESVINIFRPRTRRPVEWQWFFTPTINYRRLGENKSYLHYQQPNYSPAPAYDVNTAVTHKPDLGFQLGIISKYPVTKSLRILAGMQFNITGYDIKAFSSPTSVATIRLNGTNSADSITSSTSYNNFNGYRSNWLENLYFQVSAPIGVEVKIRGDEKVQFGIATTIQPTYILNDRAYLISTDYKNYAQVPDLVRRWNVNTNLETFVSYKTGSVKWQVGPQVRYQLLSSFVSKYPVTENLFDFGLKVGVSRNK